MFKTAAAKLAHNSTIPALAGHSELRPLQEVIATEKLVLSSLQRLSTDFGKSSEALRAWANGEGEDLGDTFTACSTLLNHWISSLTSFAAHIAHIRECLKAVRTREEALDDMHRRRKSLLSKADSAEKKLNKMNPENKNLRQQTELLMNFREQIRTLDVEIMNEEASLGDWKRIKAREWMGVLFGALLECSEKGAVVATFGRTIIGYVSTEKTQPGLPRAPYISHSQVEPLVVEAERELHRIAFINEIGDAQQPSEYHIGDIPGLPPPSPSSPARSTQTQPYASSTLPSNQLSNPYESNEFGEYNPHPQPKTYAPGQRTRLSSFDQQSRASPTKSTPLAPYPPQGGSGFTPGHNPHLSQSSIRSGSGFTPGYPPPPVAPALHPTHSSNNSASGLIPGRNASTDDTFSSSIAKALGEDWSLDGSRNTEPPRFSVDGPPPSYAIDSFSTPNPPSLQGPSRIGRKPAPVHIQEASNEDDDGVGLSYLNPSTEDDSSRTSEEKRLSSGSGYREDRKVRWGSVRDVDTELEKRYSEEARRSNEVRRSVSPAQGPKSPSPAYRNRSRSPPMPEPHPHAHQPEGIHHTESPTSTDEPLPNPNGSDEGGPGQLDERSLNALAAREIGKQMGVSGSPLSPPSLPFSGRKSVSPRPSFTSDIPPPDNSNRFGQNQSQLPPPPSQFTDSMQTRDMTPTPTPSRPPPVPVSALPHPVSTDSAASDPAHQDDAYHTPPEYLRNISGPPSPSISQASPTSISQISPNLGSSPSTPTTTKKISAAAFRRPGMKGPSTSLAGDSSRQDSLTVGFRMSPNRSPSREMGDDDNAPGVPDNVIAPLNLRKKSLPGIPEISTNLSGPRDQVAPRSVSSPFPNLRTGEEQPGRMPPLSSSPEPRPGEQGLGGDEEFDYVSAYLNDERRQSAVYQGAANGQDHSEGGPGTEGYGSGRFATRLDH